jgi:hypothetical protein
MKTKIVLVLCVASLFSFVHIKQDVKTTMATYQGFQYEMYNFFSIPDKDGEDAGVAIAFSDIPENILEEFDLKSDELVDMNFEVTYEVTTSIVGEQQSQEVYILKSLKRIN